MESIAGPLKNRFVYKFHFNDYTQEEKRHIIKRYLKLYHISASESIVGNIEEKVESTPREIHNFVVKIRDYLISHSEHDDEKLSFQDAQRPLFDARINIEKGGLTPLHRKYLDILDESDGSPVGVKTIAVKL